MSDLGMVRLYLVRHGWTAWHSEHRVAGWSDVPLDARGQAEAQATGRWLAARVDAALPLIVSSPVTRALQTAELI
ncbi:MAG: phosphoglycerate mutase family protein, partial [Anaerolineae bacterium]|nr:phosphoglycerate mutase family protein [Anaerolineae bacterium]